MCGGYYFDQSEGVDTVKIWDFEEHKWHHMKAMSTVRCRGGVCADNDRVFVGGGSTTGSIYATLKDVEWMDIEKNIWCPLKNTNNFHNFEPIMWMEGRNLLYIASTYSRSVERMDIRENKWEFIVGSTTTDDNDMDEEDLEKDQKTLEKVFGESIPTKNLTCRLLKM